MTTKPTPQHIRKTVESIVQRFPKTIDMSAEVPRFAYEVGLVVDRCGTDISLCDIGGGWGSFALTCAAVGMKVTLLDDFRDFGFYDEPTMTVMKALYAEYGVTVISRDVVTDSIDFPPRSLDVVTIFDSLEHWHHSPKKVLRAVMETLKPNGYLITGTPNCVNLRKRITVPLGIGKWSALEEWYEKDVFRSHVREPDVEDLRYIARDIGLSDVQIEGRNWIGYSSRWKIVQTLVPFADRLLRLRPSLCSNLYMIGRNPAAAT